jgi:hypothetical protein
MLEDYRIKSWNGSLGVCTQTERAQNRVPGVPVTSDLTMAFRTRADLLQFVRASEAEGFTFAGNELLGRGM